MASNSQNMAQNHEPAIPFGSGNKYCKKDLSRASFCAEAIYYCKGDSKKRVKEVTEFLTKTQRVDPCVQFGKVYILPPDIGPERQKFLVAYADDAIFIAFGGMKENFEVDAMNYESHAGQHVLRYHQDSVQPDEDGNVFLGPHQIHILNQLHLSGKRLIFCGHNWGGAMAHRVVLRFWALQKESLQVNDEKYAATIFSIAFGAVAPHICDINLAAEVNRNDKLKLRFFNFVIRGKKAEKGQSSRHSEQPALHPIGNTVLLDTLQSGSTKVDGHQECIFRSTLINKSLIDSPINCSSPRTSDSADVSTPPPKVIYAIWRIDDSGKRYVDIKGKNLLFLSEPVKISCQGEERIWDTLVHSDTELIITNPNKTADHCTESEDSEVPIASMDTVLISTAFGTKRFNIIKEPVEEGNGATICRLLPKILQTYMIQTRVNGWVPRTESLNKLDNIVKCVPSLSTIAPGKMLSSKLKELANGQYCPAKIDGALVRDANRIVTQVIKFVNGRSQIEFGGKTTQLDESAFEEVIGTAGAGISRKNRIVYGVAGIALLVTGSVALPAVGVAVAMSVVGGVAAAGLCTSAVSGIGVGGYLYACYRREFELMLPTYIAMLATANEEASFWMNTPPYEPLLELCEKCLPLAQSQKDDEDPKEWLCEKCSNLATQLSEDREERILEAGKLLCHCQQEYDNATEGNRQSVAQKQRVPVETALEFLLEDKVAHMQSGNRFKMMVENGGEDLNSFALMSPKLKGADKNSTSKFLNKIKIVVDTISLYEIEVKKKKFVGIVGAEDAGKSTFIKKVLERFGGNNASKPEPSIITHTAQVQPFEVRPDLFLVDFPGSNGIGIYADSWKQFTALNNSCIMLLDFKNDIKTEQVEMYKAMKQALQTDVTVVFNKVDERFTPRIEAQGTFTKEYFHKLRQRTAAALGCNESDVYYASLDPDPAEKLVKLKELGTGVVGFEDLAKEVLGLIKV